MTCISLHFFPDVSHLLFAEGRLHCQMPGESKVGEAAARENPNNGAVTSQILRMSIAPRSSCKRNPGHTSLLPFNMKRGEQLSSMAPRHFCPLKPLSPSDATMKVHMSSQKTTTTTTTTTSSSRSQDNLYRR